MFDTDELITFKELKQMGVNQNIKDKKYFINLCDAIYTVTSSGDNTDFEKIIIKAIKDGYGAEVCYLIDTIWSYEHKRVDDWMQKNRQEDLK